MKKIKETKEQKVKRQFFAKAKPDGQRGCLFAHSDRAVWGGRRLISRYAAYEMHTGMTSNGKAICCRYGDKKCVNPGHLEAKRCSKKKRPRRPWSEAEVVRLRQEWGELSNRSLRALFAGRSLHSIALKAAALKLPDRLQGRISTRQAAMRFGYSNGGLKTIIEWGSWRGMPLSWTNVGSKKTAFPRYDEGQLQDIVELFLKSMTRVSYADECGITYDALSHRLRRRGPPTIAGWAHMRLLREEWDAVVQDPSKDPMDFFPVLKERNKREQLEREQQRKKTHITHAASRALKTLTKRITKAA